MNIICDKTLLSDAVAGVSKAITSRNTMPILEGIHIKADGFQITLTGYDLEMAITRTIEANVRVPGEVVLSAKLFGDMVRRIASDTIEINCDERNNTVIRGGITEYDITSMDASDFPNLPNTGTEHTLDMPAETLRRMIDSTIYAVSSDDKKPAHTGELFGITKTLLTMVALDGYRLAITSKEIEATKDINIIIPQKTLAEVTKLIGDDETVVHIAANRRYVVFSTLNYTIMSRLIEGEFLDYERVMPTGYKTRVVVDTRDFINVVERASLIITERLKNPLRVQFESGGMITVRCQTTLGKVVDEMPATIEGDTVEIGFNNRYLLDALRFSGCDKVALEINGPLSPVKIVPVEDDEFIYLVLPVRFKNEA